jgi:hypothetical protein
MEDIVMKLLTKSMILFGLIISSFSAVADDFKWVHVKTKEGSQRYFVKASMDKLCNNEKYNLRCQAYALNEGEEVTHTYLMSGIQMIDPSGEGEIYMFTKKDGNFLVFKSEADAQAFKAEFLQAVLIDDAYRSNIRVYVDGTNLTPRVEAGVFYTDENTGAGRVLVLPSEWKLDAVNNNNHLLSPF